MQKHLVDIAKVAGKRIDLLDRVGIPAGWVIASEVPPGFWDKCKAYAIPLKPTKVLGIFPTPAVGELEHWKQKYGEQIMVVLIPDEESFESFSGGPILLKDLESDPNVLLDESLVSIGKDSTLSDMKRRCAMLLLGWVDTK
jgi:hypothetical protein